MILIWLHIPIYEEDVEEEEKEEEEREEYYEEEGEKEGSGNENIYDDTE